MTRVIRDPQMQENVLKWAAAFMQSTQPPALEKLLELVHLFETDGTLTENIFNTTLIVRTKHLYPLMLDAIMIFKPPGLYVEWEPLPSVGGFAT